MPRPPIDPLRRRVVDRLKVTHYLLDPQDLKGGPKSRFFLAFGFHRTDPHILAHALLDHVSTGQVTNTIADGRGWLYEVVGTITTPDGRNPEIVTVWIVRHIGPAEFVTAYPA